MTIIVWNPVSHDHFYTKVDLLCAIYIHCKSLMSLRAHNRPDMIQQ